MTKEQLIYLVLTSANRDDVPGKKKGTLHRGDVERHCELAYSDICREVYNNAVYYRDYGQLDAMTKRFDAVEVEKDTHSGEMFCYLPAQTMNLPNNAGIRMVMTRCDQALTIKYRPNNNKAAVGVLEVFSDRDLATYYVENGRLIFDNFSGEAVDIKLIPVFSWYHDMDTVPLIGGYEGKAFDMVMARLLAKGDQTDTTNQSEQ